MKKKIIVSILISMMLISFNTIYAVTTPISSKIREFFLFCSFIMWALYIIFAIIYGIVSKKDMKHKALVLSIVFINLVLFNILIIESTYLI